MSKRTSTGLIVLAALAAIVALLAWKWPRRDAPQTPEALAQLAVESLAAGDLERFRAAIPIEADLHWAGQHLNPGVRPDGDQQVWDWVASHGTSMPVAARPFASDEAVFEVLRGVAPSGLLGGNATFVGLDSMIDPNPDETVLPVSHIRFRVAYRGHEHRFLARSCFPCPRGWVCLEGLRYQGPVLASLAAVVPGSLIFRFSLGSDAPGAGNAQLWMSVIAMLRERLRRSTFLGAYIVGNDARTFDVVVPASYEERQDELVALMTRRGSFLLRIEVLPEAEYRKRADAAGVKPAHPKLWPGTAAEFHAFKASEVGVWRKALETGVRHVPTRPGFLLAKGAGKDGSEEAHFHVVAHPAKATEAIHGGWFDAPEVTTDAHGKPVLVFRVKPARRGALWTFTRSNLGMPMAILIEGEYLMAPVLVAALRDIVQVSLGAGATAEEARAKAEAMAPVLGGGAGLPVTPKFVGLTRK